MARRTKKVGSVGRLGPRYGVRIRRRIQEVDETKVGWHACPRCLARSVKREGAGIWRCRRCDHKFAGGAYRPIVTTSVTRQITPEGVEESPVDEEVL